MKESRPAPLESLIMLIILLCCAIISLVTIYDCYLSLKTRLRPEDEYNPWARWVLRKFGLTGLVTAKALGNVVVILVLPEIYLVNPWVGMVSAIGAAGVMMVLAGWLWYYS